MEALIEELKECIVESLELEDVTPAEIDPDAPLFVEGLGLDSIDAVELVAILEKKYGIQVTEMETARAAFETVRTERSNHYASCPQNSTYNHYPTCHNPVFLNIHLGRLQPVNW